jgi:glycosyltransferase involved in cell wall biosynthesis
MIKMKICYLANAQSVHTQKWVKFFADKGHEVHLISFEKAHIGKNIIVHNLKRPFGLRFGLDFLFKLACARNIKRLIEKINPDILHAHYLLDYGLYGALCGFKPFVVTSWGSDALFIPSEGLRRHIVKSCIAKYVLGKADLVTGDSESLMMAVVSLGVHERKANLIIHGVDLRMFHPIDNMEKFKKDLGVPQSYQVVISTRNLEPIYDVVTLIKAVPYVLDECPNTYFLIVGDGTSRHSLEELAFKLSVTENVRFIGSVANEEMPKFLGLSDIYVSTSLSDTRSVSLLEAMACELPVVVTDLEGNIEWIENGTNGFLFHKGDFRALAEKILFLLRNEDTRRKFGVVNRSIAEKEGDYQKEMSKMEKLYKDLVEAYKA